jgi:hypothetical protein
VLVLAILALAIGFAAVTRANVAPGAVPTEHRPSVHDSPGYVPLVDPESMSVVVGRRLNAPKVSKPFVGGARSLEDLARRICAGIHHSSHDSLMALCITDDEFRDILWREFPHSRPATGLTWEDGWRTLYARLHAGCSHALRDYGDHVYQVVNVETDSIATYRNFKLYSRITVVVKDDEGSVQRWRWIHGIAERKGAFKIYSTED